MEIFGKMAWVVAMVLGGFGIWVLANTITGSFGVLGSFAGVFVGLLLLVPLITTNKQRINTQKQDSRSSEP